MTIKRRALRTGVSLDGAGTTWRAAKNVDRPRADRVDRAAAARARAWSVEARLRSDATAALRRLQTLGGVVCRLDLEGGARWIAIDRDGRPIESFSSEAMERLRADGALRAGRFGFGGRLYRPASVAPGGDATASATTRSTNHVRPQRQFTAN